MNEKKGNVSVKNPVQQILDETNFENITLFDDENHPIEFEQIAIVALDDENGEEKLYAFLMPLTAMQGVNDGECVLFALDPEKNDLCVVNDQNTIDRAIEVYEKLIEEDKNGGKK